MTKDEIKKLIGDALQTFKDEGYNIDDVKLKRLTHDVSDCIECGCDGIDGALNILDDNMPCGLEFYNIYSPPYEVMFPNG